ncbi:MAG: hypothetical protein JSS79_16450 [Bacteroidetes bacterium]|nr:hypothetical protein [Bacteroidota bacterium]
MNLIELFVNWRAIANSPAVNLAYPLSFLFVFWLFLKAIEQFNKKRKEKKGKE